MGPLKSSDSESAKQCGTPTSAMKKANDKASSSADWLPGPDMGDSTAATANAETTADETEDYSEGSAPAQVAPANANEELASRPSSKKAKVKSVRKPSVRTVSRRKAVAPPEPVLLSDADTLSPSPLSSAQLSASPKKERTDRLESLSATSKPVKNVASSFSLSQNYQSVNQSSSDRIAIFIDGSNLFYAASHLNIEVDYRRLLSSLVRGRRLLRAYFYTGVDPQNEKQRGFLLWLNRHGHRVVSKELTHLPDGSRKANMHVEMAVDMMRISEYCPNITLLGGDGNLAYALEVLSQRGTFIEVVSLQSMTSDSLIDLADSYTDLADLRDDIKR